MSTPGEVRTLGVAQQQLEATLRHGKMPALVRPDFSPFGFRGRAIVRDDRCHWFAKAANEVAGMVAHLTDGLGLLLQGHVVFALRLVEVLNGIAQRGARHGCGEPVKELQQSVAVSLAGLAHQPPTAL